MGTQIDSALEFKDSFSDVAKYVTRKFLIRNTKLEKDQMETIKTSAQEFHLVLKRKRKYRKYKKIKIEKIEKFNHDFKEMKKYNQYRENCQVCASMPHH